MKPSEKAKEYGTTMKEITEITGVSRFSQINWFSKRPKLFEIVCIGVRENKKIERMDTLYKEMMGLYDDKKEEE